MLKFTEVDLEGLLSQKEIPDMKKPVTSIVFDSLGFAQDFEELFWGYEGIYRISWKQYDVENIEAVLEKLQKESPMRSGLHYEVLA